MQIVFENKTNNIFDLKDLNSDVAYKFQRGLYNESC